MNGLLFSLEGIDGSGKSTQADLLDAHFQQLGRTVVRVREPGGSPIGEELRELLMHRPCNSSMTAKTELLLMIASRAQLVDEIIRPALTEGKVVLCDRFYDSTTAYQGYGRELALDFVKTMIDFAVGGVRPHLTFLLQIPLGLSTIRRRLRETQPVRDRMEEVDQRFSERVINGYQAIASAEPLRVRVIDGTREIDAIHDWIWSCVTPFLHGGSRAISY